MTIAMCKRAFYALMAVLAISSCAKQENGDEQKDVNLAETFSVWPSYENIDYDFLQDYEMPEMPQKNMTEVVKGEAWRYDDRWFTFVQGPNANDLVKENEEAARNMLARLNDDFAFMREEMGWLPDRNAMEGYRSAIYLYGSGLSTDSEPNTATGGWQGSVYDGGKEYPMLLLSYYPVYCFDPDCKYNDIVYHTDGVVHEGIHCLFSSRPAGKKISWFHEGCNTWLQKAMTIRKYNLGTSDIDFGWLAAGTPLAPFIPIECYGGWRTDGSWGSPYWMDTITGDSRNILGGIQYSEVFPSFLEVSLGDGSIKWIWENCKGYLLDAFAAQLGEEQLQRMILEYRSRICLADLGIYSDALLRLENSYFNTNVASEGSSKCDPWRMTPYAVTQEGEDGWLVPEKRTLPGWSGANIIPIKVSGSSVTVSFDPLEEKNMVCQLCWRTKDGSPVYAEPFESGDCMVSLEGKAPANDVIFAVVCNRTYKFSPTMRTKHFDYRLKLGEGAVSTASVSSKWFNYKNTVK